MTKTYEKLREGPQTGINRSQLNFAERSELRVLQVRGTTGLVQANKPGKFTSVYYLAGDERAAAKRFADVNAALLDQVDFSTRNLLQTSLPRHLYDLILDVTGHRRISKYPTVVLETRRDDSQWVISRDRYETQVDRRYTTSEPGSARVPDTVSLPELYRDQGETITETQLRRTEILGDVRQVLDYFRVDEAFECDPITAETGELAVKKRPASDAPSASERRDPSATTAADR